MQHEFDFVEYEKNVKECRLRWNSNESESDPRDLVLDVDGEAIPTEKPDIQIV